MNDVKPAPATALRVGEPDVAGPLAVYPVFSEPTRFEFRAFAEAAALGATVRELARPSPDEVVVHNPLDVAVLLYEGEELRGAQQDRTLDIPVLVPAGARLEVPVSGVERARWDHGRRDEAFAPAPATAFPRLRRAKSRAARLTGRADRHEVWTMVDAALDARGIDAPTRAMREVFEDRRGDVERMSAAIARRDGQVGAVAAIRGRLCVADVVGRPDVYAALHRPLVAGYAIEALQGPQDRTLNPPAALVERFVAGARTAPSAAAASPGLGDLRRFASAPAEGTRLTHDGELIALTAFPSVPPRARVRRPGRRR